MTLNQYNFFPGEFDSGYVLCAEIIDAYGALVGQTY